MSEATRIPELFGSLVFNERTMEQAASILCFSNFPLTLVRRDVRCERNYESAETFSCMKKTAVLYLT